MSAETPPAEASAPLGILDEAHLARSVLRLAWPVVIQQLGLTFTQLVDTVLVGHLGKGPLAGVGLASIIYWIPLAGSIAIGIGAMAVVARNIGSGDVERTARTVRTSLLMSVVWGVFAAAVMWLAADPLLTVMGAEADALDPGVIYMRAAAYGLPLYSFFYVGNACMQGAGNTRTPMYTMLMVNVVNAVVAYVLIYGPGPLPGYGVIGSGLGYTIGAVSGAAVLVALLARGRSGVRYDTSHPLTPDGPEMGRILDVGVPAGMEQLQWELAFVVYTRIIASLGTDALAAHQVALRVEGLAFYPGFALGIAAAALVGQSLGAQRPDLAEKTAAIAARWGVVIMTTVGVTLMLLGGPVTSIFVEEQEVIDIGQRLLFIFAFAMPSMAVGQALAGGLRGAGDTRAVLAIAVFGMWGVRLLPAYLLAVTAGFGAPGAWVAATIDINARGLLIWLRFRQGKWKLIQV